MKIEIVPACINTRILVNFLVGECFDYAGEVHLKISEWETMHFAGSCGMPILRKWNRQELDNLRAVPLEIVELKLRRLK
jgi:hypothetical protein